MEDDDKIICKWKESEDVNNKGYWYGVITQMVEETDEQFQKRQNDIKIDFEWSKQRRYESYLRFKAEFE